MQKFKVVLYMPENGFSKENIEANHSLSAVMDLFRRLT